MYLVNVKLIWQMIENGLRLWNNENLIPGKKWSSHSLIENKWLADTLIKMTAWTTYCCKISRQERALRKYSNSGRQVFVNTMFLIIFQLRIFAGQHFDKKRCSVDLFDLYDTDAEESLLATGPERLITFLENLQRIILTWKIMVASKTQNIFS